MKAAPLLLSLTLAAAAFSPALAGEAKPEGASAGAAVAGAATTNVAAAQSAEKKICRREQTTGARTGGRKLCLTKKEWKTLDNGGSVSAERDTGGTLR